MSGLDAIQIEKSAVIYLKQLILPHRKMNDFINDNDKEPSWDGMIYLYKENGYKAEDILCRVPVQIKGKNDPSKLNNKGITYPIEYKHLRNYEKDGGVVYFVVYMSNDCSKYQIFYNCLTPVKLQDLLKGTEKKKPEQKKSVPMLCLNNNDVNKLFQILNQFNIDKKNQGISKGQVLRRSIDKNRISDIDSISWSTYLTDYDEIIRNIANGEICLYGHDTITDMWYPFSFEEQKKIELIKYVKLNYPFGIDNQFFYNDVILKDRNGERLFQLSENLIFNDTEKKYHFKPISTLNIILNDIMFFKALRYGNKYSIGMERSVDVGEITFPKVFLDHLEWWEKLIAAFKEYDIKCTKRMDQFTDVDWKNVNCLVKIYSNDISSSFKSDWWMMWWEDKVYPIYIADTVDGTKKGYNLISSNDFWLSIEKQSQHLIIPNFFMYKRDIWEKIYDFDESVVLEQLERCDYNEYTEQIYYELFIELLSAYDKTKNEKLYDISKYLANKFEKINPKSQYGIINKFQLLKRKRSLTEMEILELEKIWLSPVDDLVSCATEILLDNKHSARTKINSMSIENQEAFRNYPIYNLL